ncbi:MAG: hypothetical protein ABEJ08_06075 [Halobacteriaceae archaeon]
MNRSVLALLLRQSFPDSDVGERRVVARQAGDLADDGRFRDDTGEALAPQRVVEGLSDAPDDRPLVERWNWWMGALDVAHGDYARFAIRQYREEQADDGPDGQT